MDPVTLKLHLSQFLAVAQIVFCSENFRRFNRQPMSLLRPGTLSRLSSRTCRGVEDFWRGSVLDSSDGGRAAERNKVSGDSWPACLLRMKSFDDLHKLWYVCLKEKNMLMSERQMFQSYNSQAWTSHGRLKKVKLTMKRILTVLSRRAIHEQCVRAREILEKQTAREELESRSFLIQEQILKLEAKVENMKELLLISPLDSSTSFSSADSSALEQSLTREPPLTLQTWEVALGKYRAELTRIEERLVILRKDATQALAAEWQLTPKYSDIPGTMNWKKPWIRAVEDKKRTLVRSH